MSNTDTLSRNRSLELIAKLDAAGYKVIPFRDFISAPCHSLSDAFELGQELAGVPTPSFSSDGHAFWPSFRWVGSEESQADGDEPSQQEEENKRMRTYYTIGPDGRRKIIRTASKESAELLTGISKDAWAVCNHGAMIAAAKIDLLQIETSRYSGEFVDVSPSSSSSSSSSSEVDCS